MTVETIILLGPAYVVVECGMCGEIQTIGPRAAGPIAWMIAHHDRWHPAEHQRPAR